ncbi:uncharacterized protein ASCRUDRAFT_127468 [Ascoidea rubescens DSM 1968]|uniref:Uncharacterized protein n=1 Tax=Ascoidea rubescens DSM 1968 TaxID=1344418 RepID=A0A1D2VNE7_9ASCO|nr:hypothetical protein ASCRUDRAFT_127468 [Ascoidea rubescens DSM 1968]ODV63138.1 hypothetical protein ASCRUDRAFT_127468 [Ascoidea rubescens DSM 1968]
MLVGEVVSFLIGSTGRIEPEVAAEAAKAANAAEEAEETEQGSGPGHAFQRPEAAEGAEGAEETAAGAGRLAVRVVKQGIIRTIRIQQQETRSFFSLVF